MARAFLECIDRGCGRVHGLEWREPRCGACGNLLDVSYEFDPASPEELRRCWRGRRASDETADRSGVWRFRELLPFLAENARRVTLGEGGTPLVDAPQAGRWAGDARLTVKHLGTNPTGSFKDLGMTTCVSAAVASGARVLACASTGNTSASMAAYAARAGLPAVMFVPYQGISAAKLAQAIELGARVVEVRGSFDDAFRLLAALASERGWYVVNSVNPYRLEGQKTAVVEILEQREWQAPEFLILPGGNLGNVSAMGKALRELARLDLVKHMPRLVVVQAEGAAPFYRQWRDGGALKPVEHPETEATAIRIGRPANWQKARRELEATGGMVQAVSDAEIFEAKKALAADGLGCEPASAATLAGLRKLRQSGGVPADADTVAILTGHQLKDPDFIERRQAAAAASSVRVTIDAGLDAARRALDELPGC